MDNEETARNTGMDRRMHKGRGTEEHDTNPLVPAGGWSSGQARQGWEQTCGRRSQADV